MEHQQPSLLPNYTMFIQMGIFVLSWTVIHFLVIRPYSRLFHKRHEATDGLRERAHAARDQATKLKGEYEEYMKQERKKIASWMEDEKRKIVEEQLKITQQARNEVADLLQKAQFDIKRDIEKTKKELLPRISEYSSEIVNKLVGNKIQLTISNDFSESEAEPVVVG